MTAPWGDGVHFTFVQFMPFKFLVYDFRTVSYTQGNKFGQMPVRSVLMVILRNWLITKGGFRKCCIKIFENAGSK